MPRVPIRAPLVGRESEVSALRGWLEAALANRPGLVLVSGEPGIGKTRLCEEFLALAGAEAVPAAWGRSVETEGVPPFWLWRQVVRALGEDWDRLFGSVGERFQLFESVCEFLRAAAAPHGLVVVLDDLHWSEDPSLQLLVHLARFLGEARLLVVATCRDSDAGERRGFAEALVDLIREGITQQLRLVGLNEGGVAACLSAIAGEEVTDPLVRQVLRMTDGNPFFVGELARALTEPSEPGDVRAVRDVPATVREAVRRRVTRLSGPAQQLVRAAATLGSEFPVAVAAATAGMPVMAALPLLDEVVAAGIAEPGSVPGAYRFVHAILRHAADADLGAGERVRLHAAAAAAIEEYYAGRLEPHLAALAHHRAAAAVAGDRGRAASCAQRAAGAAMQALAYEEAVRLYRLALEVGGPEIDGQRRSHLLIAVAGALYRADDLAGSAQASLEAAAVARSLGRSDLIAEAALVVDAVGEPRLNRIVSDLCEEALSAIGEDQPARRARLLAQLSHAGAYLSADADRIQALSREATALAERSGDPEAIRSSLRARQLVASWAGHLEECEDLAGRMLALGRSTASADTQMWGRLWKIDTAFASGRLREVEDEIDQLAWCVEQVRQPLARWHLLRCRAAHAQAQGRFAESAQLGGQALEAVRRRDHLTPAAAHRALLAAVGHHTGYGHDVADPGRTTAPPGALRLVGNVIDTLGLAESGRTQEAGQSYAALGKPMTWEFPPMLRLAATAIGTLAAIALGSREDVAELSNRLVAEPGRHVVGRAGTPAYWGPVELYLGEAALFLGRSDDAVAHLMSALAAARSSGARGFAVEAAVCLAEAWVQRAGPGDLRRARDAVTDVLGSARALGMAPFVMRTEQLLAALGVPPGQPSDSSPLTSREREVAGLVGRGFSNHQIAESLVISPRTAQNHVQHILTKLGFSARSQIAAWVARRPGVGG